MELFLRVVIAGDQQYGDMLLKAIGKEAVEEFRSSSRRCSRIIYIAANNDGIELFRHS